MTIFALDCYHTISWVKKLIYFFEQDKRERPYGGRNERTGD